MIRAIPAAVGAPHRLADRSGDRDMIVLDHRRVPQPHAVIGRAAHPRRIFLERAQARDRLARVEQDRAGARDPVDIGARQRRDARQMLDGVERRALGGEQRARVAARAASGRFPARRAAPSCDQPLDLHRPDRARERTPRRSAARRRRSHRGCPSRRRTRASAGITAADVMSPPSPRSSASVAGTKASRSKPASAKAMPGLSEGAGLRKNPHAHSATSAIAQPPGAAAPPRLRP